MKTLGMLAYEEWIAANSATGVNVRPSWDQLLEDERYAWDRVAAAVAKACGQPSVETSR
jgi:hypothetical protein